MPFVRLVLDLAVPKAVYDALPAAQKAAFRDRILEMKALAVKINQGQPNEEATVRAVWHLCNHDQGLPCGPEQEI